MDKFKAVIILFFISPSLFAANLCDDSCELLISFPNGGQIEAVEPLTFTFGIAGSLNLGETGTVNTAIQPDNLDYSSGGSLSLAAGESISFADNGELSLGTGGNLDYSNIQINSTGTMQVTAVGGQEEVHLFSIIGTNLSSITISAAYIYSYDALDFDTADLTLTTTNYFITQPVIGETINWLDFNINTAETVQFTQSTGLLTSESLASGSLVSGDSIFTALEGGISLNDSVPPTDNVITLADAPNNNLSSDTSNAISLDSITSLPATVTIDTQSCTLLLAEDTPQCETNDGIIYQFIDGEWVELEATGMLSPLNLILLYLVLWFRRKALLNKAQAERNS